MGVVALACRLCLHTLQLGQVLTGLEVAGEDLKTKSEYVLLATNAQVDGKNAIGDDLLEDEQLGRALLAEAHPPQCYPQPNVVIECYFLLIGSPKHLQAFLVIGQ